MSTIESKRTAGMGLPTQENNPILQRQREFGSKSESSGMTFKRPFVSNDDENTDDRPNVVTKEPSPPPPHSQLSSSPPQNSTLPKDAPVFQPQRQQTSMDLTDEQILALAKERGLELQPKKLKYIKHTYSVTEYNHDMIPKISSATGITIQELMKEAMDYVVSKYYASYEYSLKAPTPKKR